MITINLSSSALSLSGCLRSFKYTVIDGYKEPSDSANIIYGEAIHKFVDVMYKTDGYIPLAREAAMRTFDRSKVHKDRQMHLSDVNHMNATCFNLWERWVKEDNDFELLMVEGPCYFCKSNGEFSTPVGEGVTCERCDGSGFRKHPATELTFSFPYYQDEFLTVNLAGTIDSLGKIKNGCYSIRDWKTTSTYTDKGYFDKYRLSKQLRFYNMALKIMAEREPDSILGTIGKTNVGCMIDAVFIKPAANDLVVKRSEVFQYSEQEIREFRHLVDKYVYDLGTSIKLNHFPKNGILTESCEKKLEHYNKKCPFFNVCAVGDEVGKVLLARDFKVQQYNPLNYSGI